MHTRTDTQNSKILSTPGNSPGVEKILHSTFYIVLSIPHIPGEKGGVNTIYVWDFGI